MSLQEFNNAISELPNMIGVVFPALNPNLGGDSTIIKVNNVKVSFMRNKSSEEVSIDELRLAYQILSGQCKDKDPSEWDKHFKKSCGRSFFMQFMVHFGLGKVSGKGVRGDKFEIELIEQ